MMLDVLHGKKEGIPHLFLISKSKPSRKKWKDVELARGNLESMFRG